MLSRHYFASEDILYPQTRENLEWNLKTIANLTEMYAESIVGGSPESDDDFRDYALALLAEGRGPKQSRPVGPVIDEAPDVTEDARRQAERWIIMAKSETLEKLGEHRAAQALAEKLITQAQ